MSARSDKSALIADDVDVFRDCVTDATEKAAQLLSVALELTEDDLASLLTRVWDVAAPKDVVGELLSWPLAERTRDGWRISESYVKPLVESFASSDAYRFRLAHQILVEMEEDRERQESDFDEGWFIRGRVAFYLSAVDAPAATSKFGIQFRTAPPVDRTACRLWLTNLFIRQEDMLGGGRVLSFYKGYRYYVTGRRREALREFEDVLAGDAIDMYTAIASHLLAVLIKRRDPRRCVMLLRRSIQLSEKLGLDENYVMALHTLSWAHVYEATTRLRGVREELAAALSTVRTARTRAEEIQDAGLLVWCRRSEATIEWLVLTENRTTISEEMYQRAASLVGVLREAAHDALRLGELETAVHASNDAAAILRDVGEYSQALDVLEDIASEIAWVSHGFPALNNIAKTSGSIVSLAEDVEQQERARSLLDFFDERWDSR